MTSQQNAAARRQAILVAVVSADDAVDRAAAIANLACVLASNDRSVLVLDLPEAVYRVADYLAPFAVEQADLRELGGAKLEREYATTFNWTSPADATLDRFELPGEHRVIDVHTLSRSERDPRPWLAAARRGDADRLRSSFVRSPYDYVLINAPSLREQSDEETRAIFNSVAKMCDVAVVCFSHRVATVSEADRIGRSLHRRAPGGIQVVPVNLGTGRGEAYGVDLDARFADLLADNPRAGTVLSLPDVTAPIPVLALFLDEPNALDAYGALANAVTFGAITALGDLPAAFTTRYRRAAGFAETGTARFLVADTPAARLWADWITDHLRAAGAEVGALRTDADWLDDSPPPELLVVGTPAAGAAAGHRRAAERAASVTQVVVDEAAPSLPGMPALVLAGLDAPVAAARLRGYFGLKPATGENPPAISVRHPDEPPDIVLVPPIHHTHVGREEELARLRDRLLYGEGTPVRLAGPPGVGKTALAREYAYRYANAYAVVWWISAHDRESVLSAIVALGRALRGITDGDVPGPLELLGSDLVGQRWLLVFDDGDDPGSYADLLPPPGRCHVIITSAGTGDFEVPPLSAEDNTALLAGRLPQLVDTGKLEEIAAAVGYSPLAMELTSAWLTEVIRTGEVNPVTRTAETHDAVDAYLAQIGPPAPGTTAVARVVEVISESLAAGGTGRMTLLLAQFCALLSPDGVSLALLRSKAVRRELIKAGGRDAAPLAQDAAEIDILLAHGARIGLFRVDWGRTRKLTAHRVIRRALQDALPEGFEPILREHVLRALANYAPTEQEEDLPTTMSRYAELNRHVMSTRAQDSDDPDVRQWLVNQTGYLFRTNEADVWQVALAPAQQLYDRWVAAYSDRDPYVSMLAGQLARLYRALGRYQEALELNTSALNMQRRHQGRAHYRSLLTARGLGADLRGLGRLEDAVDEDIATLDGLRAAFGEDHPHTLSAENNLAAARFHAGDLATAHAEGERHCARRDRLFGPDDPRNWHSLANLGIYQRAMGLFDDSIATLARAHELASVHRPPPPLAGPVVAWLRSVSERLAPDRDTTMAKGRNGEALVALRDELGDEHVQVVACKLSYANAHRAVGEAGYAVTATTECLEVLSRLPGIDEDHPYPATCRAMLALALLAAGRPQDALAPGERGWRELSGHLGSGHPLSLAAQVNHAVVLSATGRHDDARLAAAEASRACANFLPGRHYYRDIASANARRIGGDQGTGALRTIDLDISMP